VSAQPDYGNEPIDLSPMRDALRRILTDRRDRLRIPAIAQAFASAANSHGARYDALKAERVMNDVAATNWTLLSLPRWLAESLAIALDLDISALRPEGSPTPLRAVPYSERKPCPPTFPPSESRSFATPAGKGTARTATATAANVSTTSHYRTKTGPQGNHDAAPSAGDTGATAPSVATPPASPADEDWRIAHRCGVDQDAIFFPSKGASLSEAKAICVRCPIRAQCLREGLRVPETKGVWGGTNDRQRRKLKAHQDLSDAELLALADRTSTTPERSRSPKPAKPSLVAPEGMKRCKDPTCRALLPLEEFRRNVYARDGRDIYCKPCARRKDLERKAAQSPAMREAARKRNSEAEKARYRARKAS